MTPTTLPRTIDALIATLAANPNTYGSHATDLLKSLQQIQRDNGKKQGENSVRKTIDEVSTWIADETLDRPIGTVALQLLSRLAQRRLNRSHGRAPRGDHGPP